MIGLDTNVVVRYRAIVLCELAWVLAECHGADRARIHELRLPR